MRTPLFFSLVSAAALGMERPNIVFLFADDHATAAISAYGSRLKDVAPTPGIDRIAHEGMLFTNSFCSNSICGPSRAAILTGKHSHINGYLDNNSSKFDGDQTTFPKLLQKAGYQTALVGKWHLVSEPQGFDYWEVLPGQGNYYNPDFLQQGGGRKRYEGYVTDIVTDRAIEWLDHARDTGKPFVLMCQHKAPHRNWSPAPRHLTLFDDVEIPEPGNLFDDYAGRHESLAQQRMSIAHDFYWDYDMKIHGEVLFPKFFEGGLENHEYARMNADQKEQWDAAYEPKNMDFISRMRAGALNEREILKWKYQRYMKDYLRTIRAVDENVGRLLEHLDETGLSENTIVIYSSDQGFYLGEHGWYDKRWMFEQSLQMPFMVRWPGVTEAGTRSGAMIQNIDYAPTFLEAGGAGIPAAIQGRSLVPILRSSGEEPDDWRDAIYYYYSGEETHRVAAHDGVRTKRYKLMHFSDTGDWNLFDLEKDPQEMESAHADPGYAEVMSEMKDVYHEKKKEFRVNEATIPKSRLGEEWWERRHKRRLKDAASLPEGGKVDMLLVGDSITQGWEGEGKEVWARNFREYATWNLGFSGDRTEHVLWRLLNGELDHMDPKVIVLMIGTNNTGQRKDDPSKTAMGVQLILELLRDRRPDAEIILTSLMPRGEGPDNELRRLNGAVNARIEEFGRSDPKVHWMEVGNAYLRGDGTIIRETMPDLLHPGAAGYEVWAQALKPKILELLAE